MLFIFNRIYLFFWNLEFIVISDKMDKNILGKAFYPFIKINKQIRHRKQFDRVVNHERIHHAQQLELLIIPFYIWYLLEYFYYLIITEDAYDAYRRIRFERECYRYEKDLNYLAHRKPYNYLFPDQRKRNRRRR